MGKGDPRSKRGRPRKEGERYPSGKLKPQKDTADLATLEAAAWNLSPAQATLQRMHRHQTGTPAPDVITKAQARDLIARNTELGRLFTAEPPLITEAQRDAGIAYAKVVWDYRRLKGLPTGPQSATYGQVRGGGSPPTPEAIKAASEAYSAAQAKLQPLGLSVAQAVHRACVLDQRAATHLVQRGLKALAEEKPKKVARAVDS